MGQGLRRAGVRVRPVAGALLIALAVAIVYHPTLDAGFVWDDDSMLTDNFVLREGGLRRAWLSTHQLNYWPVTSTIYWLEHRLWGANPRGYHATNLILHAACAILVWRILRQLRLPAALASAVVFAVHPVNAEAVAWVAQRKTLLAHGFLLLSLLLYLRFDRSGRRAEYGWAVACCAAAMLSKGSAATLPVAILLSVWWRHRQLRRVDLARSLPFFAVAVVMVAVEIWFQQHRVINADVVRAEGLPTRAVTAGMAVWFYLGKAVWPVGLSFVYPRWSVDPSQVIAWVPSLAVAAAVALAWRCRQTGGRAVLFALGWYIALLLPVLGFADIYFFRYSLVADHYQYGAIIAPIALLVGAADRLRAARPRRGAARHQDAADPRRRR